MSRFCVDEGDLSLYRDLEANYSCSSFDADIFVVEVAAHERAIVISKDYSTLKKLVQFIDI
jgi:hypothetical protein